jgi:hypothetical protein
MGPLHRQRADRLNVAGTLYNKGSRIIQALGVFMIQNEMVPEARIVSTDGSPHRGQSVRTSMGDGRGHWEGNTMVLETTNFVRDIAMNRINLALLTVQLKIVERFTRIAPG